MLQSRTRFLLEAIRSQTPIPALRLHCNRPEVHRELRMTLSETGIPPQREPAPGCVPCPAVPAGPTFGANAPRPKLAPTTASPSAHSVSAGEIPPRTKVILRPHPSG